MRIIKYLFIIVAIALASCNSKTKKDIKVEYQALGGTALYEELPLYLNNYDFNKHEYVQVFHDGLTYRLESTIRNYYREECSIETKNPYKHGYIHTLYLQNKPYSAFLILLEHFPSRKLNAKVLFNKSQTEYCEDIFDFNLHAMYKYSNGKLIPTNLMKEFEIKGPEIQLVDYNKDGVDDFKFTRLMHNGTFNAMQTTIISIDDNKIDTLFYEEKIL